MKKITRLCSLLLALALMAGLTACGETTDSTASAPAPEESAVSVSETPQETHAPAPEASTPEEPASVVEEPENTYTGAISAADSSVEYPIADAGVTLTFWTPFNTTMPGVYDTITDIPAVAAISEATGVDIEWTTVSGGEMFSSFNLMAAAGDYCDLITAAVECYSGGAVGALDDGIIVDLTDYIQDNCPQYLEAYVSRGAEKDITTVDGRYACLYGAYNELIVAQGYVIRQDWLDALKLETPVTYDDFFEVLTAFKNEYGCSDTFMLEQTCQAEYHTSGGFGVPGYKAGMFGAGSDLFQKDGVVCSSFNQEGYHQYLQEMNKWYEAGLFSADFATLPPMPNHDARTQLVASNNSGIWYVNASSIQSQQEAIGDPNARIAGIADPVQTPGEKNHFSSATIINKQCNVSVSSDCENVEAALQYLNFFFTDEGIRLYNYGVEGESYTLENGELAYTDLIMNPVEGYTPYTMSEAYILVGYIASVTDVHRADVFSSEASVAAQETWNASQDNEYVLPAGIALSSDESGTASALMSDLYTYVGECIPKFILGEMDIDTQWEEFVNNCESMGLPEILEIYQAAYDRYAA